MQYVQGCDATGLLERTDAGSIQNRIPSNIDGTIFTGRRQHYEKKAKILKRVLSRIGNWELWPFSLIYAPLAVVWLYYIIRARTVWFFSNVNPTLEFAGFEGENKKEMYEQLPEEYCPKTMFIGCNDDLHDLEKLLLVEGMNYPFVVKPQVGMQAMLFRRINNRQQLQQYHDHMQVDYIIQQLIELPMEFSVFYIRYPGQSKGKVTGFTLKDYMSVTGDGNATLQQLIDRHPKARYRRKEMQIRHQQFLKKIIPPGEKYYLSTAGNHNRGAKFINLEHEIDQRLCKVFDGISRKAGYFYFGRYDLKCTSVSDLKEGKNIAILEFNGAGAEPNHIYDCGMSYGDALKVICRHWQHLYAIGRINNKNGIPYWSFKQGWSHIASAKKFFRKMYKEDLLCPTFMNTDDYTFAEGSLIRPIL